MFHPAKLDRPAVDFKITRAGSITLCEVQWDEAVDPAEQIA
jgi:hypothetical protein